MEIKCKIFRDSYMEDLQNQINIWLKDNQNITILNSLQSSIRDIYVAITIFYKIGD